MPRGSVKIKKVMATDASGDADALNDMFAQMTGAENADPDIIIPKMVEIQTLLVKYYKIYDMLLGFKDFVDNFPEAKRSFDEIKKFSGRIQTLTDDEYKFTEQTLKSESPNYANALYKKIKDDPLIQTIVVTSGNLGKYKKYLDKDNLRDEFIKREPGLSYKPLTFTNLDLKVLWVSNKLTNMAKKYILNILSHTYTIGHRLYQIITSPNIDIKKFSEVLIANIDKMKKRIPRCNKAFDIIADSVSMLENNFEGYYKTSVEAENPSIIIESFIIDVSMKQKSSASITSQFRKIIMFMKRQSANSNDPRVAKLFKILNSQFDMMKQETGMDPSSDDEEDSEADVEAKAKAAAKAAAKTKARSKAKARAKARAKAKAKAENSSESKSENSSESKSENSSESKSE
jgi:hypothetical protein